MKFRNIFAYSAAILAVVALILFWVISKSEQPEFIGPDDLEAMEAGEQEEFLSSIYSGGKLPVGSEEKLIAWTFANQPELGEKLIRENANKIPNMAAHLSDASLLLVKQGNAKAGVGVLELARNLYPNNPDVLGITGVIAYLSGREVEARQYLEEAETWRQNRPIVDFYLGGILVESSNISDRTRGKNLLLNVVNNNSVELRELAGLILLSNLNIPMIDTDIENVYSKLKKDSVFREGNENLSAEAIRLIINRVVTQLPDEALTLANLLVRHPEASISDKLGIIQLAQDRGENELASQQLDILSEELPLPEGSPEARRYERILAVQLLADEQYEKGITAIENLVATQSDEPALRNTFQTVLAFDLSHEVEKSILNAFLKLPVNNVENHISVLSRLRTIDPLGEDKWNAYATEKLLPLDPVTVSQWLQSVNAADEIIEAFADWEGPLSGNEQIALIEAYLHQGKTAEARVVLEKDSGDMDPTLRNYLECRILVIEKNFPEAFEVWTVVQQQAANGKQFPLLKNLGFLALTMDQEVNALQSLYTAFSAGIPFNRDQALQLLELTLKFGNLDQSIEVSRFLASEFPDEAVFANNLAYFNFLAETQVEESIERMRELVETYPEINQYRLTLALGLVKAGRTNEANRIVQSTNIDWNTAGNRSQMIYSVVLAASNQRVVAEGLIRNLNMDELIPEERALLEAF